MSTEALLGELLEGTVNDLPDDGGHGGTLPQGDEGVNTDLVEGEDNSEEADIDALEEANLLAFAGAQVALHEQMNIVRLNKQTQLLNLTNRSALILAKRANDTLFAQYAKFNALRLKARGAILKKYGSRASAYARKLMTRVAAPASKK